MIISLVHEYGHGDLQMCQPCQDDTHAHAWKLAMARLKQEKQRALSCQPRQFATKCINSACLSLWIAGFYFKAWCQDIMYPSIVLQPSRRLGGPYSLSQNSLGSSSKMWRFAAFQCGVDFEACCQDIIYLSIVLQPSRRLGGPYSLSQNSLGLSSKMWRFAAFQCGVEPWKTLPRFSST